MDKNRIARILITVGSVLLVLSIVCFIGAGISASVVSKELGMGNISVSQLKEMIEQAKSMSSMLGGSVAEVMGISPVVVFLISFCIVMRIWLLVLGIIALVAGLGLKFVFKDSTIVDKTATTLSHGISGASAVLKGTIDKATSKCPKCGKVCSAKTAFCPSCGEKMIKPEPAARPVRASSKNTFICPNCKKVYPEKIAFCSACGKKMPDERPKADCCRNCGAINAADAKFCSACGNDLTVVVSDDIFEPATVETEAEIMRATVREEPTPIVHIRTRDDDIEKPSVKVLSEKKNPFMNKPNKL